VDIFQTAAIRDLEKLNFSINEAKVYITLLRIGSSFAGKIAQEAHLDRSSTYNALKMLMERGVVSTVMEGKRSMYCPSDPKRILDYYDEKKEIAQKVIPELRELHTATHVKKNVTLFQGFKGVKTIFQDILNTLEKGDEYNILGSEGQFGELMPYFAPIFSKRKEQKKIHTKMLIRESFGKKDRGKYTEYRSVPQDVRSPATINVYGNKVAIFVWGEPPEALLIENSEISKTLKNYFDFMWKHAKKV